MDKNKRTVKQKINPYNGLPSYKDCKYKVVTIEGNPKVYYIQDSRKKRISKILTKVQLNIATQHTLNALSMGSDSLDEIGQALVNFAHENKISYSRLRKR